MSIGSTKKIESAISASIKSKPTAYVAGGGRQFVEDIDTTNNVLVRDDAEEREHSSSFDRSPNQNGLSNFKTTTADISTSIEALALTGALDSDVEQENADTNNRKITIYNNNQSIIKDEEIERTGRSYLKHFYEKNEAFIDVDEFV